MRKNNLRYGGFFLHTHSWAHNTTWVPCGNHRQYIKKASILCFSLVHRAANGIAGIHISHKPRVTISGWVNHVSIEKIDYLFLLKKIDLEVLSMIENFNDLSLGVMRLPIDFLHLPSHTLTLTPYLIFHSSKNSIKRKDGRQLLFSFSFRLWLQWHFVLAAPHNY